MNALMLAELLVTARKSERVKVFEALRASPLLLRPTITAFVTQISCSRVMEDYRVKTVGEWVGRTFPSSQDELQKVEADFAGAAHPQVSIFFAAIRDQRQNEAKASVTEIRRLRFTPAVAATLQPR